MVSENLPCRRTDDAELLCVVGRRPQRSRPSVRMGGWWSAMELAGWETGFGEQGLGVPDWGPLSQALQMK
jgi:hypothetical protein